MEKKTLTLCGEGLQSFDEIIVDRGHHTKANREESAGALRGKAHIDGLHGGHGLDYKGKIYDHLTALGQSTEEILLKPIGAEPKEVKMLQDFFYLEDLKNRSAQKIWEAALGELQLQVTGATYRAWLEKTSGLSYRDNQFVVGVPNTITAEYLARKQCSLIEKTLAGLTQPGIKVHFQPHICRIFSEQETTTTKNEDSTPRPLPRTQEVVDKFIDAKRAAGLQPRSIENYRQVLHSFARQHPALPSGPEEIEAILSRKSSDGTRLGIYKVLSAFYKFANQRLEIPDIMLSVQKPRVKPKEPDCLTPKQAGMVLDAIETDRERGLVYLYLGQGLRLSEALRLDIRDVGEDLLRIKGKERDENMPLLTEVREALLELAGNRGPNEPLFIGQQGRLGRDMAEENIKRLFNRAGVTGVQQSPKIFRSTFASMALNAGCDFYLVKRLLRHSRGWDVTDRHYIHLSNEELRKTLERYSPLRLLQPTFRQTTGLSESRPTTNRDKSQIPAEADPAKSLPQLLDFAQLTKTEGRRDAAVLIQLLDNMVALGEAARVLKCQLGGNGHRPEKEYSECQG